MESRGGRNQRQGSTEDPLTADDWGARCLAAVRPPLGMTADEKDLRLAQAEQAIRDHALALEAVRVLEAVGRGPAVRSPRNMARKLRRLAEHFEEASR